MDIQKLLLTQNMFSRPGKKRESVKGIAIHWVANAESSALANRNYFESLKNQSPNDPAVRCVSAHFVIGIGGEIVQCVPLDEMAYHAGRQIHGRHVRGGIRSGAGAVRQVCAAPSGEYPDAPPNYRQELPQMVCRPPGRI
jgi:N-acetylmuramoyl-L-alanine amidase